MSFNVPDSHGNFAANVIKRFRILLQKRVITGIDVNTLDCWWKQFQGPEAEYLGAHLLDALIYRSEDMMRASCQHALEFILPNALSDLEIIRGPVDVDQFMKQLGALNGRPELRFVAVDGAFSKNPAKSGIILVRMLRDSLVHREYFVRPENLRSLPQPEFVYGQTRPAVPSVPGTLDLAADQGRCARRGILAVHLSAV